MKAKLEFQKALLLLDYGKLDRAREKLELVIGQAENEKDTVTLVQSLVCLGDLLIVMGTFQEAAPLLKRALTYRRDDDVLEYELNRASELLSSKNN
jgi:tetratricopeptide (TPR) repeat protein